MNRENIARLSPPWYTYHRKLRALFGEDPEISIKEMGDLGEGKFVIMILVSNKQKAQALKSLIINPVSMGNITITLTILGPEEDSIGESTLNANIVKTAFDGNPIFEKMVSKNYCGIEFNYCVFKKEVIQYWNDDISDYRGICSCLAADIAREILVPTDVSYCTYSE